MSDYGDRVCPVCGNVFNVEYANQVCCSDVCQAKRHKKIQRASKERAKEKMLAKEFALEQLGQRVQELQELCNNLQKESDEKSERITELQSYADDAGLKKAMQEELDDYKKSMDDLEKKLKVEKDKTAELEKQIKSLNAQLAKARESARTVKPIEEVIAPDKLEFCKRLNVKALHLPCGQRPECWTGKKPCEKTEGMTKPDNFELTKIEQKILDNKDWD